MRMCFDSPAQGEPVTDDKTWLGLACENQVTQVDVVFLHRGLSLPDSDAFVPKRAEGKEELALLGMLVNSART